MMSREDLEYVVRSMLFSVASGVPYAEDYYYQVSHAAALLVMCRRRAGGAVWNREGVREVG